MLATEDASDGRLYAVTKRISPLVISIDFDANCK
jgi:hypothetical protein